MNVIKVQFPKNPIIDILGVSNDDSFKKRSFQLNKKRPFKSEVPGKQTIKPRKIVFTGLKNHQTPIKERVASPITSNNLIKFQEVQNLMQLIPPSPSFVVRLPKAKFLRRVESDPDMIKQQLPQLLPIIINRKKQTFLKKTFCTHFGEENKQNQKIDETQKQNQLLQTMSQTFRSEQKKLTIKMHKSYRKILKNQKLDLFSQQKHPITPSFTLERFGVNDSNNEIEDFFSSYVENQKPENVK